MEWQFSLYLVPLVLAGTISSVLVWLAVPRWDDRTAPQLVGILVGAAIWSLADAARLATGDLGWKLVFHDVRFLGSTLIVFATVLFALEYTNRERWLTPRYVGAIAAPFVVTVALVVTSQTLGHDLIRSSVIPVTDGGLQLADFQFGPWFYVNAVYSYLLLGLSFGLYVVEILRGQSGTYRRQTAAMAISLLVPWVLNALYLADVTLVDLTAVGLTVTGVAYYAAIFWFDLLELMPIARSTLLDHIEHGVLVLDPTDRVVDANESMLSLLGRSRNELVGSELTGVETRVPDLVDVMARESGDADVSLTVAGTERHFEVETSPVYSDLDRYLGRLVLVRDVTEFRQQQAALRERTTQLERQNEQLDRFASVVSHDLRNPINTASGYLELGMESGEAEHLEKTADALERMDDIVDDVLALARESQSQPATEPVSLHNVVSEAWETVETGEATLENRTDRRIEADRARVLRLLENLFRNAVDHGPPDVTVTVEDTATGFTVADDGPGIPESQREEVFESGFSTADDGTGFGLSIVDAIANAHGWSIEVSESDVGGTRFEIDGARPANEAVDHSTTPDPDRD